MKVHFESVGKYEIHDTNNNLVEIKSTIGEALSFVRDNWVEGENLEIKIVDGFTGEVICTITD